MSTSDAGKKTDARSERRRAERARLNLPVRYRPVGSMLVDEIENLSETGMLLSCAEPHPIGTALALTLPEGRSAELKLEAEVVRVIWGGRNHGAARPAAMALHFTNLGETQRRRLKRIIASVQEETPSVR